MMKSSPSATSHSRLWLIRNSIMLLFCPTALVLSLLLVSQGVTLQTSHLPLMMRALAEDGVGRRHESLAGSHGSMTQSLSSAALFLFSGGRNTAAGIMQAGPLLQQQEGQDRASGASSAGRRFLATKAAKSPKPPKSAKPPKAPKPPKANPPPQGGSFPTSDISPPPPSQNSPPPSQKSPPPSQKPPPPSQKPPPPPKVLPALPPPPSSSGSSPPVPPPPPSPPPTATFSPLSFGAVADGVTNDSVAIVAAFAAACSHSKASPNNRGRLIFPAGVSILTSPISLVGPCGSKGIVIQVDGTILGLSDPAEYPVSFDDAFVTIHIDTIPNLAIVGNGVIDGQGQGWWQLQRAKLLNGRQRPNALEIVRSSNLLVQDITIKNPGKVHISISRCNGAYFLRVKTKSPYNSPNTDSIHVSETKGFTSVDCVTDGGDDNYSIEKASSDILIHNATCLAGHGISIGSLGSKQSLGCVSNVEVRNSRLVGLQNGLRIKTYQGSYGAVQNIKFKNIILDKVSNAIVLDQFYCDGGCAPFVNNIAIKDIIFENISGTTNGTAIALNCSATVPCTNIVMKDINISNVAKKPKPSFFLNVFGTSTGLMQPPVSDPFFWNGVALPDLNQTNLIYTMVSSCPPP